MKDGEQKEAENYEARMKSIFSNIEKMAENIEATSKLRWKSLS